MSKSYEHFANLYDQLMEEAPYSEWVSWVEKALKNKVPSETSILELGAGTGSLALKLIEKGYRMVVSDYSEEMLTMAEQKLRDVYETLPLYWLDMRDFELNETFDAILIFCDAINYLSNEEDLSRTFKQVYDHLKPGGCLLFDAHTPAKIEIYLTQQTFGSSDEALSYLWECFPGEEPLSVIHDLTFFVQNENGLYKRLEESHEQRTYPLKCYKELLEKTGFKEITVEGDFDSEKSLDVCERWTFSALK